MRGVSVQPLTPDAVNDAYVLARLGYGTLSPEEWRRAVLNGDVGEVLVAREGGGPPCGLLICAVHRTLFGRPFLHIERLISFDLMEPRRIAVSLLLQGLEYGRRRGCEGVAVSRAVDDEEIVSRILASDTAVLHQVF